MDSLFGAIAQYIKVSEELKTDIEASTKSLSFKKREVVLHEHQICKQSYFIQKGILRLYYIKDGKEISEYFCAEHQWINSPKSFIKQEIDVYYIDAIEDAEVLSLPIDRLMYLFNNYPEMERYARLDMGSSYLYLIERLATSRFSTATEKYQHFLETYKDIHHRIPLGMVASYIGITQETLSRLRKKHYLM